jgi:hypothetical protein
MQGMSFKFDDRTKDARVSDLGSVLGPEKKPMSTPRKVALAGALALTAAFAGQLVRSGGDVAHKLAHKAEQVTANDRVSNPDNSTSTRSLVAESRPDPSGVSDELKQQTQDLFKELQAEAPTSVLYEYQVQDGDSPAGLVEKSLDADGNKVTDTVQYGADRLFIEAQMGENGLHKGDIIKLAPGTNIPGQTTELPPANPPTTTPEY